jgi:P-type Ca2+ transporter type 2C
MSTRTNPSVGLSASAAQKQLEAEGPNELPSDKRRRIWTLAIDVLREPMFLLLFASGAIYAMLGDRQEAVTLLGFVLLVAGITLYQEQKTERALEALKDLSSPRALVVRDGLRQRIPGREVVRGDVLVISEGDRVPADAALVSCLNLSTDESLLTGESVPVRKSRWDGESPMARPGGDDLPFIYAGTLVTHGHAAAEVLATGIHTEMGRIGRALQTVAPEPSALQRETRRLVRRVAVVAAALCGVVALIYGLTRGSWLNGCLVGLTLAMAILPNELPAVLTIFLALGAWRMSQKRALVRRIPALEALGSATVLCVDKTGTLTQNQMSVRSIVVHGKRFDLAAGDTETLPDAVHELVEYSILAGQREPFDPMEKAFKSLGHARLSKTEHLHPDWELVRQYPLSDDLFALSHVWRSPTEDGLIVATKGAFEAVARLSRLPTRVYEPLQREADSMAAEGLRVLAVAKGRVRSGPLPRTQHDFPLEFVGFVGLADPVRPAVPGAIADCYRAGIRIIMITGDHPNTAVSIGRQIGLHGASDVLTGLQLNHLDDQALKIRLRTVSIFARVVPEQKLRLVRVLKELGEVVAMTGDGVNDAPALKAADIGVAMGGRGTDVARESASLVILDDDFSTIVQAIRLGRRVFENLKNAMAYLFAVHVPIAGITVVAVLMRLPLVLLPVHVAFLHLIIEPACAVAFEMEAEHPNLMERPPRSPTTALFGTRLVALSVLQGASVLAILAAVFLVSLRLGKGEYEARALTFTTLVVANLALILVNRSWDQPLWAILQAPNRALWWIVLAAIAVLAVVLYVPPVRELFRMSVLHLDDIALSVGAGFLSVGWFEVLKVVRSRARSVLPQRA